MNVRAWGCFQAAVVLALTLGASTRPLAANPDEPRSRATPAEIDDPLPNPFMGWGLWVGPRFFDGRSFSLAYNTEGFGDDAPLFGWVLVDWMWSDLEPEEGKYDWAELDAVLRYWSTRHKQFLVRLWVTTDPGWAGAAGNKACPDWLWGAGVAFHSYRGEGAVARRCPAYADPSWEHEYLPRLRRFLAAYRDRYHKPGSPIILDQVMGYGDWGEWHSLWSHYPWPSREQKRSVLKKVIETYAEIFSAGRPTKEPLRFLSIAQVHDDDCPSDIPLDEAMHRQALDVARARGMTFSRHGFIDGLSGWPNELMDREWKDHPLIAESNWSYDQVKDDKRHGTMAEHIDAYSRWHSTYAHMYFHAASYRRAMKEDSKELERALRAGGIGYRFVLKEASWERSRRPGEELGVRQTWVNRNRSWCPQKLDLKVVLADGAGRVVWSGIDRSLGLWRLLAGTNYAVRSRFTLPADLRPGAYRLGIALTDDRGERAIRLAIAEGAAGGVSWLGQLVVVDGRH